MAKAKKKAHSVFTVFCGGIDLGARFFVCVHVPSGNIRLQQIWTHKVVGFTLFLRHDTSIFFLRNTNILCHMQ